MRIVALSDQHGHLPEIPACDLLIIAGDVCPDRFGPFLAMHHPEQQNAWFNRNVRPWLAKVPATHKILTWGNHDWCGQTCSFRNSPEEASTTDLQIVCRHHPSPFVECPDQVVGQKISFSSISRKHSAAVSPR